MRSKQIFTMRFIILFLINAAAFAQETQNPFRQMGKLLPAPNAYRSASGAPGPGYWQQRADYDITVKLDENAKRIAIGGCHQSSSILRRFGDAVPYSMFDVGRSMFDVRCLCRFQIKAAQHAQRQHHQEHGQHVHRR